MKFPSAAVIMFSTLSGAVGCTSTPTAYKTSMDAAEEARRQDRFEQERSHFAQAAENAKKPKDAGEARYRRAQSWVREGDYERGAQELQRFARAYPQAIRAARAWLDAGRAWEKANKDAAALRSFEHLVNNYPESGNALAAARRIVELRAIKEQLSHDQVWRSLLMSNGSATLDEALRYHYAKSLEKEATHRAILTYEDVARRHPLPAGSYADEALLRAAELRRANGDAAGALATIDLLLEQGGPAAFVGSYTRTAYIEGLLLRGKVLRDDLGKLDSALATFESLPNKYPKSRLVDDALWEAIVTRRLQGENGCDGIPRLTQAAPDSRYRRCTEYLCGGSPVSDKQRDECENWLGVTPKPEH